MRYVIAVKQPVYGAQGAFLAYQFVQQLIEQNHQIDQIFFFQHGVNNGNIFTYPANDEFNLVKAWQQFGKKNNVPLHLCVAASQRRGIVDNSTAYFTQQSNLAEGFVIAGLGEFTQSCLKAERVITL